MKLTDLKGHVGDSIMVEGAVKSMQYPEGADPSSTFITLGNPNNSLIVVITEAARNKFTVKPEDAYKNKSIRVSGRLVNNNGRMQIVIDDPAQIVLVDKK